MKVKFLFIFTMSFFVLFSTAVPTYAATAPNEIIIDGKKLKKVVPGGSTFNGTFRGSGIYWIKYYPGVDYAYGRDNPPECWKVWSDYSVRKGGGCYAYHNFLIEPFDDGWSIKDQYINKYMMAKTSGDVLVTAPVRDSWEKYYIYYYEYGAPYNYHNYYIMANSNGKWVTTDWTGWVVANRDKPSDWERVWISSDPNAIHGAY